MKLNEKGFAFSTMLYGSITLITIVLYVILNINKASNDTTYFFGEEILKDLNNCVTEEIALENCYSSGANNCNATAYHACLGVSDNNLHNQGTVISETLKQVSNSGLVIDQYENNRYVYTGGSPKNYLQYSGKIWRIVSIEPGGTLKLVDTSKYTTVAWDTEGKDEWGANSTLYSSLNLNYLSTFNDTSKIVSGNWYASILLPSLADQFNINDLVAQEKNGGNDILRVAKVGLLSISDYLKAIDGNSICKTDIFGTNTENCNSWLSQYKSWTIAINGEFGSSQEGYAYYFGDGYVSEGSRNNKIFFERTDEEYDVYPVIFLDRNSVIKSGEGTQNSPYILK